MPTTRSCSSPRTISSGTVNEDFRGREPRRRHLPAGNGSYRIQRVERGLVRVEDAHGMAPTIPFWLGEAPGRSDELSASVSQLRNRTLSRCCGAILPGRQRCVGASTSARWIRLRPNSLLNISRSVMRRAWLLKPTQDNIVLERIFRRSRRYATHRAFALRQSHQSSLGASGCGSGSAASSISSHRQPPLRTTS